MEELERQIEQYIKDNEDISSFKKMFRLFDIDIPVNVRKKLETREKKNNTVIDELMRKQRRLINELETQIENGK